VRLGQGLALEPGLARVQAPELQEPQVQASVQFAKRERLELRAQSLVQVAELARLEPLAQV